MTQRGLVCLLLGALAWGQAAKPASPPPTSKPAMPSASTEDEAEAKPAESKVAPDAAVITIPGACDNASADTSKSSDCKTVITRAQFEKLIDAVAPSAPPSARRQIANRYASMLVMAKDAEKQGLDKGEHFEEMMKLMRLQVLAQALQQSIQQKAAEVPEQDMQDYYNKNQENFEQASLQRLFIPKSKALEPAKEKLSDEQTKKRQEEAEAAMKTEADTLYKRAQAGEDFAKLQEEAFQFAGMKAKAPSTNMPDLRRNSLPLTHRSVFDLKAGQISPLITDTSGYFVYKMGEKQTLPLEKVKDEVHNTLRAQRMNEEMEKVQKSATPTLNDEYFGAAPEAGEMPGPPGRPMPTPKPASESKPK
jgi:hypothetical protein